MVILNFFNSKYLIKAFEIRIEVVFSNICFFQIFLLVYSYQKLAKTTDTILSYDSRVPNNYSIFYILNYTES